MLSSRAPSLTLTPPTLRPGLRFAAPWPDLRRLTGAVFLSVDMFSLLSESIAALIGEGSLAVAALTLEFDFR